MQLLAELNQGDGLRREDLVVTRSAVLLLAMYEAAGAGQPQRKSNADRDDRQETAGTMTDLFELDPWLRWMTRGTLYGVPAHAKRHPHRWSASWPGIGSPLWLASLIVQTCLPAIPTFTESREKIAELLARAPSAPCTRIGAGSAVRWRWAREIAEYCWWADCEPISMDWETIK